MELVTSTLVTGRNSSGDNIHRDFENTISNIDRQDTPFVSKAGSRKVNHIYHEWPTDDYQDAQFQAYKENYQYAAADVSQEVRTVLGNYCQIFNEPYGVSATSVAVDTAGVANEFNYQGIKKGVRMRRNIERQALNNPAVTTATVDVQPAVRGSAELSSGDLTSASQGGRRFGSVFSYALTHSYGAVGTNNVFNEVADDNNDGTNNNVQSVNNTSTINAVRANGTSIVQITGSGRGRAFSRAILQGIMADLYSEGARPTVAMMSPNMKATVSDRLFADGTGSGLIQRTDNMDSSINMMIDVVRTDFGTLQLVPNWLYNNATGTGNTDSSSILIYDPSMIKLGVLREMKPKADLRQNGDGFSGLITCEKTLIVQNPASVGVIHGINTTV